MFFYRSKHCCVWAVFLILSALSPLGLPKVIANESASPTRTFKTVIVGSAHTGKKALVTQRKSGQFSHRYIATYGSKNYTVLFETNRDYSVEFKVCVASGQEKLGRLQDGYYVGQDAAIVVFSVSDKSSLTAVPKWKRDIRRVLPDAPMVLVASKSELSAKPSIVKSATLQAKKAQCHGPVFTSAAKGLCLAEPFLILARLLTEDETLEFTGFDTDIESCKKLPAAAAFEPDLPEAAALVPDHPEAAVAGVEPDLREAAALVPDLPEAAVAGVEPDLPEAAALVPDLPDLIQ